MDANALVQVNEWSSIYARLLELLGQYGVNDAFGEGDYWLVDDNWGDRVQMLHIFNIDVLTPDLVEALSQQLADHKGWQVMVSLDVKSPTAEEVPSEGLIINGTSSHEHWDRTLLKSLFGDRFHWAP